jgi:Cys-tRNA(Pro) deacylase
MSKNPVTRATLFLEKQGIEYSKHTYDYKKSGAILAAEEMGVDPHSVIKTLIMRSEEGDPFIVLMHGDLDVSLKRLAREVVVKKVSTCSRRDAQRYTGYTIGGISPFATKRVLPVYMEHSILTLPLVYINGGKRGFVIGMNPYQLHRLLKARLIHVKK